MKKTNIVVVICHDLGQHLGCYGSDDVRSANIDAFAESGVRFENSFCTAPQCSPSRAALWTGRFPHANGVVGLTHAGFGNDLHSGERHIAEMLRDAGYESHLFGVQHESPRPERCGYTHIHPGGPCRDVAREFIEYVSHRPEANRPLFAQIGFFEPHRPFPHEDVDVLPQERIKVPPYLPDIEVVREDLVDIEASISSADMAFGEIVNAIKTSNIADNTIIIFTADHGIPFPHAKMTLYDPGIEVPLIFSGRGIERGVVTDEMISNIDVLPTIFETIGLDIPNNLHGRSFAGLFRGTGYSANRRIFAEKSYHTYYDPMRAIRTEGWKLIANFENAPWQETSPDYENNAKGYAAIAGALAYAEHYHPPIELYDLEADPTEQTNLADDPRVREIKTELSIHLRTWMEDTEDPLLMGPIPQGAYVKRMRAFKQK